MSEPKRFALIVNAENDFDLIENPNGDFIRYFDFAALQAENERLRKAGDAMADYIKGYSIADKQDYPRQVFDWLAAKGVQP